MCRRVQAPDSSTPRCPPTHIRTHSHKTFELGVRPCTRSSTLRQLRFDVAVQHTLSLLPCSTPFRCQHHLF